MFFLIHFNADFFQDIEKMVTCLKTTKLEKLKCKKKGFFLYILMRIFLLRFEKTVTCSNTTQLAAKLAPGTTPAPPTKPAARLSTMFPYRLGITCHHNVFSIVFYCLFFFQLYFYVKLYFIVFFFLIFQLYLYFQIYFIHYNSIDKQRCETLINMDNYA